MIATDVLLAVYLFVAVTAFNEPDYTAVVCNKVNIDVSDNVASGFLSAAEIKGILQRQGLYPLQRSFVDINPRSIEEALLVSPFVKKAECYKACDGTVSITIEQRLPIVRVKSDRGDDYYIDERGGVMPNSKYMSDLIIASGNITRQWAVMNIVPIAKALMQSDLWRNQIEQIYIRPDNGIELVPRVGDHCVYLGSLPSFKAKDSSREEQIIAFVKAKMDRLEKFYKYGLTKAGWNKYSEISLEYDNQVICKKRRHKGI